MELHGLCVSKGNATGIVKIINPNDKLEHYLSPTIIVMKKLDRKFLVEMDKSVVGVIAEEGNIGSHGAGILRQLNIPCILRIKNATQILVNNSKATIDGSKSIVKCQLSDEYLNISSSDSGSIAFSYLNITKKNFDIHDIQAINSWICPRPDRIYQELRYSIMCDVFASSGHYVFGLPEAKVKRNDQGAILIYGQPSIESVCSFLLCSPSWLIDTSKERTIEFNKIKLTLKSLESELITSNLSMIYGIFNTCIDLYRSIFKYSFTSQAISDDLIELYVDFCKQLGITTIKDISNLKSEYVKQCLNSKIDPGVSQRWNSQKILPHIWDGCINYTPLEIEPIIQNTINEKANHQILQRDYEAFRIIIPLVYQLSEEYFYVSSSINSFINWAIAMICNYINIKEGYNRDIDYYYNMSLFDFCPLVEKQLKKEIVYE